jgi:hypothetical protein
MNQLEQNIQNIHEALQAMQDLYLDPGLKDAAWERNMQRAEDIEHALMSAKAYLELQQSEDIRASEGDLVAECYLNSL